MTRPVPNGALRRFKASIIIGAAEAGAALFVRISMVALEGTANHVAKRAGQTERTDKRRHYVRHSGRRWWWAGDNATASRTHSSRKKRVETRRGKRARERGNGREKEKYKTRRGEKGKQSSLFLPISSRFGGYPRVPTATPYGPANLVQDDCRPANPLIPFHLSIANVRSVPACTLHYYFVLCV